MRRSAFETIDLLYDAALGKADWRDIGARLTSLVDGATLTFTAQYAPTGGIDLVDMRGVTAKEVELYATHYLADDLWRNVMVGRQIVNRVVLSSELVSNLDWQNSRIYTDLCVPNTDIFHGVVVTGTLLDRGIFTLGIHRPRRSKAFDSEATQQLNQLLPHLQRALEIRRRLELAEQTSRTVYLALERLTLGVIMMGATGRLLHVNAAADGMLRSGDGLIRTAVGLRASRKDDDRRLQELISRLRQDSEDTRFAGGHLRIHRPSGRPAYAAMLSPVGRGVMHGGNNSPAILVFVSDPGKKITSDIAVLAELFGFPPGEARLVLALLSGMTAPDFARKAGVSYNTVRTLLARAMARTDSSSQLEMVQLVASAIGGTIIPSA